MTHETDDTVVATLVGIVSRVLGIAGEEVTTDANLRDGLNLQSVELLEVVLAVESTFQVRIPDAEVFRFADKSVEDIALWIREHGR